MKIYFIGIGGIGVSALAGYYLEKGNEISGSDLVSSEITENLEKMGAKIFIGEHSAKNLENIKIDMAIYSPAVRPDNPEFKEAKKLGIKCLSYPEALGELTKQYFTIAVSGAHGKSTTTAMISLILTKAGFDPTVIIGTKLKELGNRNFRVGNPAIPLKAGRHGVNPVKSPAGDHGDREYLVIEADEWQASFLNYWPKIIVLTNIEREHLDYYRDLDHILETFNKYISHLPEGGVLVANRDDININSKLQITNSKQIPNNKFKIKNYSIKQGETEKLKSILKIPGQHNIYNALAALTLARVLGIDDKISFEALSQYNGAWRRFDIKEAKITRPHSRNRAGERGGQEKITIVSDYGHHPTEVKATLQAAREKFLKEKIWCVFQPHQYQRTFFLFDDFVKVLSEAPVDKLIITDIYDVAGRENSEIKNKVSAEKLVLAIAKEKVMYLSKEKIKDYLLENLQDKQVLVIMGAGDIYNITKQIFNF